MLNNNFSRPLMSLFVVIGLATGSAMAADAEAGKAKSVTCAACHGADGKSSNPMWPNLAGQHAAYLVKQLRAFKAGTRNDPIMGPMSMALSEADIEDLAAYYAQLK